MKPIKNKEKKLALQIISVFTSIVIWLFISYAENPQIDVTLNTIPIQFSGESQLQDKGFMIINKASVPDTSITIRGKRRDLMNVMGNITSTIDVSGINNSGSFKITPEFDIPSNAVYISKRNTNNVEIDIAKIAEKTVEIRVVQKNADRNKSFLVESIPKFNELTLRGSTEDINLIDHASVYIDVGAMISSNENYYKLVYEDSDNSQVLPINDIFTDTDSVSVENNVYDKTELNINVQIPSKIKDKYNIEVVNQSVTSINAGIKNDEGRKVFEITNIADFDDITSETTKYLLTLDIPEGIYIPEDMQKIEIELKVFETTEKKLSVPITVSNSSDKKYSLNSETAEITVSGPEEKLISSNVWAELNLDNIGSEPGVHQAELEIKTAEQDITILSNRITIYVNIE